jgi:gephyrin
MSAHNHLRAAIVIVSQTAFADPSTDRTIPLLSQTLASDRTTRWTTTHQFLPDDLGLIRDTVTSICDRWADDPVNLLLTSGGTGFAQNDWTPEAVGGVLEKKAPGLV